MNKNYISIIKPKDLYPMVGGSDVSVKIVCLVIWIMGSCIALLGSIIMHNYFMILVSLIGLAIGVALIMKLFGGGQYKPGKSFYFWRLPKETILKYYIIIGIVTTIVIVVWGLIDYKVFIRYILSLICCWIWTYYKYLTFKFHEDVDFVANNEVSELLGMEIDEKVQASYQGFSTKPKSGSNMMLLTDRNIIYAYYNGLEWSLKKRKIKDIRKIGRVVSNSIHYLFIIFSDQSYIRLRMEEFEKFTSDPTLFFKKFLVVLDTFLLGKTDRTTASRRRVSVNTDSKPQLKNKQPQVRVIDISETIIENLQGAVPVETNRHLEL